MLSEHILYKKPEGDKYEWTMEAKHRGFFSISNEVFVILLVGNRELLKIFEQGSNMMGFHGKNNPN